MAEQCTIQCKYCLRAVGISCHNYRPAVAREVISPEEAVKRVSLHANKRLKVVGIAGPGEPLCNEATFKTLSLVGDAFSELILCVATNGLLLYENVDRLADLNVKTVTVTINTVDPHTIPKIYTHIQKKMNNFVAQTFVKTQLKGIRACTDYGIFVKINSVLIPGVNATDLEEVALQSLNRGAVIQNIMPLIPLGEFSGFHPPTCEEIQSVRNACEKILPQFRLCKQCRADAVGIPGNIM